MKYFISAIIIFFSNLAYSQSQIQLLKSFNGNVLFPASIINGQVSIKPKEWPITVERNEGKISIIKLLRAGVLEEIYQPDVPNYPSYFYSSSNRIVYLNNLFLYYNLVSASPNITYVLASNSNDLQNLDAAKLKQSLVDYLAIASVEQKGAKEEFKEDLAASKERERLENSLKGKNIQKLEIVWLSKESETGLQSKIRFGIKATDNQGKIFSTDNLGGKTPWDDFIIQSTGAVFGDEYLTVETDASKILSDIVTITVKDKHQPNIISSNRIRIAYATPVKLSYNGKGGCPPLTSGTGTGGGAAPSAQLDVCNSSDGLYVLIAVSINNVLLHKLKLKKGVSFSLDLAGGGGCSGKSQSSESQGGRGGNGGNGGNITINKAPGVVGDVISINNSGGRGGKGGKGAISEGAAGANGQEGIIIYNTKNIQLNF